jgi:phospholipid-binding lipoprotein MlaA
MILRILIITIAISTSLNALGKSGRCYHVYDPYENFNRSVFKFNSHVDKSLIRPFVKIYDSSVPEWGQQRVSSFFYNIKEPLSFLNYALQGDVPNANKTFWRFFVNTIFGIGGLFDFASKFDLNVKQQTVTNTMMHHDINYGAYIMIPLFGPSTARDVFGRVVDGIVDPTRLLYVNQLDGSSIEYGAATAAESRIRNDELLDGIQNTSLDTYSKTRSLYLQLLAGKNPMCKKEEVAVNYDMEEAISYE